MFDYSDFLESVSSFFARTTRKERFLFRTDAVGLWDTYLGAFEDGSVRQWYNCNCCRKFIETYGGLVVLNEAGQLSSAVWDRESEWAPVRALAEVVNKAKVTGLFLSPQLPAWGEPQTGSWRHLSVRPGALCAVQNRFQSPGQAMAEVDQNYQALHRFLGSLERGHIQQAVNLLSDPRLYRASQFKPTLTWLCLLKGKLEKAPESRRDAVLWAAVAAAPPGCVHVRSSVLGALLENIAGGKTVEEAIRLFNSQMDPSNYQRAQAAPKAGTLEQAEKMFEQAGLAPALLRRYARRDELPLLWAPAGAGKTAPATTSNGKVFGHIAARAPREVAPPAPLAGIQAATITWDKFQRTVLPEAKALRVRLGANPRWAALVTAVNPDAPPLLRWDKLEARNPVSWYYEGGADAEIQRRVRAAGGQYDDVDIRVSLLWGNRDDLDLHVHTPGHEHIYFGNKKSSCRGFLDVDMNVFGETDEPVENIRWPRGKAREGEYVVKVHNYCQRGLGDTPFRLELCVDGVSCVTERVYPSRSRLYLEVARFVYKKGATRLPFPSGQSTGSSDWGLSPGAWADVTGITQAPGGYRHVFFLLDGCRDKREGSAPGFGFLPEMLLPDLHPIRSVLDAYAGSARLEGADEATACGIGMSDQQPWNLSVEVTTALGVTAYTIDRWD